ncbi:MAG: hypothetical protein K940chlam7_02078 [Chlamydiae bacterium]|nr:hypothetical protein [Chlamydiota bacterium]
MLNSQNNWKSLLFEGIIFLLLGIVALTHPYVVAYSLNFILGFLLTIGGIVQGFRALKAVKDPASVPVLIAAAFSLIAGILLLTYPLTGIITLTLILTVFFFVDGIAKMVNSWQFRPIKGWGWLFFSGLLSLVLAILIFSGLPTTAAWVIGVYVGIYMLFLGVSLTTLSFYVKKKSTFV